MTSTSNQEVSMEVVATVEADYEKETGASYTDSLTGLFNHGFFQISLEREIKRYERYGTPFTLAIVLFSLAITVEAKDAYTQGHIERVANVAVMLGRKMGLNPADVEALRFGGTLHDIGKIGVPHEVLNKPGPLDDDEWDVMKSHPDIGYRICSPLKKNLGSALDIIRHHHEKLDGTGYPDGLKGDDVSMVARVMAVADIYDALITDRPYRKGMPKEKAFGILGKEADEGKLDRDVVNCLLEFAEKE